MLGQRFVLTLCGLMAGLVTSYYDGLCWNIRDCRVYEGSLKEFNDVELFKCLRKCLYLDGCELVVHDNSTCKINSESVKVEDIVLGEEGSLIFFPKPCGDKLNMLFDCKRGLTSNSDLKILVDNNKTDEE